MLGTNHIEIFATVLTNNDAPSSRAQFFFFSIPTSKCLGGRFKFAKCTVAVFTKVSLAQ